jgi:anti-sigma-K factor RskA
LNTENYISSGIIEQYVLGMCNTEEQLEVEQYRISHTDINNAIIQFEKSLEQNLMASTISTNASTDNKILSTLKNLQPQSKLEAKPTTAIVRNFGYKKYLAAASIALIIASAGFNIYQYKQNKEQEISIANILKNNSATLPAGDYKILTDPSIIPVAMYGVPAHAICKCTLYWDKNTGKAYVMVHHLMPAKDGKAYQLWATVEGKKVNLGVINDKVRDRFIEVSNVPFDANEFLVTLEQNGNAPQPTPGNEWVVGKTS